MRKPTRRKLLLVILLAAAPFAQATDSSRAKELGLRFMCVCGGCGQVLTSCNHIGCPSSTGMRAELEKLVQEGKSDSEIIDAFSKKFGVSVLSAPPTSGGFNLSAWLMPFFALLAGASLVVYFVRRFRSQWVVKPAAAPLDTSRYQDRLEDELKNYTPED